MSKKVLVIAVALMAVAMLITPLIGAVQAGYGGKNRAAFEWYVVQWPLGRENAPEDRMIHTIEKESGDMMVMQNLRTYGAPPVVQVQIVTMGGYPVVVNPTWSDYPNGGIRLTVTPEGEDPYTLVGSFEKTMLYISYKPKSGILENSRWSFEITAVEDGDAPDGAVGSTMYGTLKSWQGGSPMEIKSTKGTGIFEGAFLRGTHITQPGVVLENFPNPSSPFVLLSTSTGSGEIVFP